MDVIVICCSFNCGHLIVGVRMDCISGILGLPVLLAVKNATFCVHWVQK